MVLPRKNQTGPPLKIGDPHVQNIASMTVSSVLIVVKLAWAQGAPAREEDRFNVAVKIPLLEVAFWQICEYRDHRSRT